MFLKKHSPLTIMLIALLSCFVVNADAQALQGKSPLKILFVGYDVARLPHTFVKGLDTFSEKDSIRMPAFKALLDQYFAEVKTIDCRDWKVADSEPYDVTIFDYRTTAIEKGDNSEGHYVSPRYLPDNFSKPVVFIGSTADEMGRRIGLKLDWLCLCLDADAHHIHLDHPIFKGPLEKVTPTLVMKKTPDGIFEYPSGDTVPHQLPMWRVNTEGYLDSKEVRIGLVSRGNRFMDSPDAEVISSGVCQKDVTAIALGRHGNFFLWGFAGSPATMTEEAKKVFVNAVCYIKQFDGQTPIARKYNDRMATTDDIRNAAAWCTKKFWEESVEEIKKFNIQSAQMAKDLQAKKDSGKTLTDQETQMLAIYSNAKPMEPSTWEEYVGRHMGPFAKQFGTDVPAYQQFIRDNIDYMYCDPKGFYTYEVDADVQKLKISNHNTKLLEACIAMLKDNKDTAAALRILKRYTPEDFATASEWASWYKINKKRLFFTETGGYKFLVNTLKS